MDNFNASSENYQLNAIGQQRASNKTFSLLKSVIKLDFKVIDLGCGPGTLTRQIANMTQGAVLGVDISENMIEKAKKSYKESNLFFKKQAIEALNEHNEYDVIFANSSLYYVKNRIFGYGKMGDALTEKGFFIAQLAYGPDFTTCFATALNHVLLAHSDIRKVIRDYQADIFFYADKTRFVRELLLAGLKVISLEEENQTLLLSVDETMQQYESNVFLSILNPSNFKDPSQITHDFCQQFRALMRIEFEKMKDKNNNVTVIYPRMYLLAQKNN